MTSEHFKEHELTCRHCGMNGVTADLLTLAESVRAALARESLQLLNLSNHPRERARMPLT